MALEPGTNLGGKLHCLAFTDVIDSTGVEADYLSIKTVSERAVAAIHKLEGPFVRVGIDSPNDGEDASVYLNESQVDDLIVTLLYWKENH